MIDASEIPLYQAVLYGIAEVSLFGYVIARSTKRAVIKIRGRMLAKEREMIATMIHYLNSDDITFLKAASIEDMFLRAGDKKRAKIVENFVIANPERFPEVNDELSSKLF